MADSRVLIADDEPIVRDVIGSLLRRAGYEVDTACDGAEALRIAGERPPSLVLSDVRMPGVDGIALTRAITSRGEGIPVILLSGSGDEAAITSGFEAGAADYLVKPWRNGEVLAKVRRYLTAAPAPRPRTETDTLPGGIPRTLGKGRFTLGERIGAGGMGAVYAATDGADGHKVAVKVLRPDLAAEDDYVRRFLHEARTLSRVSHPGVPRVHDVGREGEVYFCAMELIEGPTLARRLRDGPLPPAEVAALGAGLAGILGALHGAGILHRDVKPENVILRPDGTPALVDFGLARRRDDPRLTTEGNVIGTIGYMPPEVILGTADADERGDLYGLGNTLYAAAAGEPPVPDDEDFLAAYSRAAAAKAPDAREKNPTVPEPLAVAIALLAHPKRDARPANAASARELLAALAAELRPRVPAPQAAAA